MIELRQLIYFQTAAQELNFANAAAKLFISRQAVAKSIHLLEDEVGYRLFRSEKGSLRLTDMGCRLLEDAQKLLNAYDTFNAKVASYKTDEKTSLSIVLAHGVILSLPDDCLVRFCSEHPEIALSVSETTSRQAREQVAKGESDVALVGSLPGYLQDFDYLCIVKTGIQMLVPASNPLSKKEFLTLEDLEDQPIVTAGTGNDLHRYFDEECQHGGIHPKYIMNVTDIFMIASMARARNCLCFTFPSGMRPLPPECGTILPLLLPESSEFGTYLAVKKGGLAKDAVQALLNYLRR